MKKKKRGVLSTAAACPTTIGDVISDTMKFNTGEFVSATVDMLLKVRMNPETIEFSLTHFMGSFTYRYKFGIHVKTHHMLIAGTA